jgi:alcohol dehydrogenase
MINFEFYSPTKVIFGKGTENQAGSEIKALGYNKVLVHFGSSHVSKSGLLEKVHKSLNEAGIEYVDLGGVVPNPRLQLAKDGATLCKKEGIGFILAVGGGSVIDSSKAIAYGITNDFDLEDLYLGKVKADKCAPVGCILTIAAAGSETSNSSVITIEKGMLKRGYNNDLCRPRFAIMDPELTYSLPDYQTASGGTDIMMHTMERYFTNVDHVELTDRISEGLLITVKENLLKVLKDNNNYDARAELMWAGSLSHNGLTGTGRIFDFASHKIEHEIGGMFDVAHGAGLSSIWGSWARYVYKTNVPKFAQFAVNVMGCQINYLDLDETAVKGIEAMENFYRSIGMPTSLKELGVNPTDEQLEELAEKCAASGNGTVGFFKKLNKDDILKIYKMAK